MQRKQRNKKAYALCGLIAVSCIGGTFAYFTQTDAIQNLFRSGTYTTELVEDFIPSDGVNWEPASKVNKDVYVTNNGSLPVAVRIRFEETWTRADTGEELYHVDTADREAPIGQTGADNKFTSVWQADPDDGLCGSSMDDSVVYKELKLKGEGDTEGWVYNPEDGWYYYSRILNGVSGDQHDSTGLLLDSVTLAEDADMGFYEPVRYYSPDEERPAYGSDGWHEFATVSDASRPSGWRYLDTAEMAALLEESGQLPIRHMKTEAEITNPALRGYSEARYKLTVTAQTVQATDAAVASVFGISDMSEIEALGCSWTLTDEDSVYMGDPEQP